MTEKPFIPRGPLHVRAVDIVTHHPGNRVTFAVASKGIDRTFHRVEVSHVTEDGDVLTVLVTPQTVVTWERLA